MKRRNGRVKMMCEEYVMEKDGIMFIAVSSRNPMASLSVLPKVQFNLRERTDRENVVLPFEHQAGKNLRIYDGRRSLSDNASDLTVLPSLDDHEKIHMVNDQSKGEIHYLRDSDDELPDSDEDLDDDLDI